MLLFILFFVIVLSSLLFTFARHLYIDGYTVTSLTAAKQAYVTGEAALEDVVYRFVTTGSGTLGATLTGIRGAATTTVTYDSTRDVYTIRANTVAGRAERVTVVELQRQPGSAFNYGIQTGNGGFRIANGATVDGNIFSNGTIEGQGSSFITGDAISAGDDGYIADMEIQGSSWSHTLESSVVFGDAHYNDEVGGNTVGGSRVQPFTVFDEEPLPIEEDEFDEWQAHIEDTGALIRATDPECDGGEYEISTDTVLGTTKIECDLYIRGVAGGTELVLNGSLWVVGNIRFSNGPVVRVGPFQDGNSVFMIADDPTDRTTRSTINIANDTEIYGSGHESSFVMLVSRNQSASLGGSTPAIEIGQRSSGDMILFAGAGSVQIRNQINLNAVTGYRIDIGNNSTVTYQDGLQNINFTGGPGATYHIAGWYQE